MVYDVNVHYVVLLYALCACALCKLQFDRVKGQVRDPSLNSVLPLTSSIYVQSFIVLRPLLLEFRENRQTGRTYQADRINHSCGIISNLTFEGFISLLI